MKYLFPILWFIMIFPLFGCSFMFKSGNAPSDDSLFNQSICSFPCWQGLVPGKTTHDEINQLLPSIEFVSKRNLREDSDRNRTVMRWWYTQPYWSNRLIILDDILSSIEIVPNVEFTLKDIMSIYGEPTGITARLTRTETSIYLLKLYAFYPEIGVIFEFNYLPDNKHM